MYAETGVTVVSVERSDVELVLPAEPESIALARQMVRGIVDVLGWGEESRTDISIAVTEACTNSVLHAYPDSRRRLRGPRLGRARAAGRGGARPGPRHHADASPPPAAGLGLGLPLILAIGDEVSFTHDDGVTEVRMTFSPDSRREGV